MLQFQADLEKLKAYSRELDLEMNKALTLAANISRESLKEQFLAKTNHSTNLRLSSLGKPALHLAAHKFHTRDEVLTYNKLITFYQGKAFEGLAFFLMEYLGYKVLSTQDEVIWNGVVGHTDGRVVCPHTGVEWLVEFKTMNHDNYTKVLKNGITDGAYVTQMATYTEATGLPGAWVCYNKDKSLIHVAYPNKTAIQSARQRAKKVVEVFDTLDSFEAAYKFFHPPLVERYGRSVSIPSCMFHSLYKDMIYFCEDMVKYTKVVKPYYRLPEGYPEDMRKKWIAMSPV